MTVLEALAILEAATLECKRRDINTPAVRDALDLLEPHIKPEWLIHHLRSPRHSRSCSLGVQEKGHQHAGSWQRAGFVRTAHSTGVVNTAVSHGAG